MIGSPGCRIEADLWFGYGSMMEGGSEGEARLLALFTSQKPAVTTLSMPRSDLRGWCEATVAVLDKPHSWHFFSSSCQADRLHYSALYVNIM